MLARARQAKRRAAGDDGFFKQAHVPVQTQLEQVQIDDRIDDQLAGTVVGDVAAAIGLGECDAATCQKRLTGPQVVSCTGPPRDRNDRRIVLDQQQSADLRNASLTRFEHLGVVHELQVEGRGVGEAAQIDDAQVGVVVWGSWGNRVRDGHAGKIATARAS